MVGTNSKAPSMRRVASSGFVTRAPNRAMPGPTASSSGCRAASCRSTGAWSFAVGTSRVASRSNARWTASCASNGTITLRRPRVRGLNERFESRLLPAFKRRTEEVGRLLPELYLHGLAQGDFDLALRGLLGEGAPLSAPSIARLKAGWQAEYEFWKSRSVADLEVVYFWVDGVYVKAGLEKDKAAILVVLAALRDGRKVILAVESGYRESTESWAAILRDLKGRGLQAPKVVVGDGHLGIWGALAAVFPEAKEQRCWNHRVPGRARSKEVRRPPAGKTFTPASQRQVVAA